MAETMTVETPYPSVLPHKGDFSIDLSPWLPSGNIDYKALLKEMKFSEWENWKILKVIDKKELPNWDIIFTIEWWRKWILKGWEMLSPIFDNIDYIEWSQAYVCERNWKKSLFLSWDFKFDKFIDDADEINNVWLWIFTFSKWWRNWQLHLN
jgi:hypothetical protein